MIRHSLAALPLLLLAAGCDLTGQYEKELQKSAQAAGQRAVFDLNLHPAFTEVVDSAKQNIGVKLRIPKVFDGNSKALAANDPKSPLPIPGLTYLLERQLDDDAGQFLPAYLMFAVTPKADQKPEAVQNAIAALAKTAFPSAAWADATLMTPAGQPLPLKRLRADGQPALTAAQKKAAAKTESRIDVYLVDAGANYVLIGWLTPKAQAQKYQLEAAIDAAMGTLENTAPPAPPGKAAPAKAG